MSINTFSSSVLCKPSNTFPTREMSLCKCHPNLKSCNCHIFNPGGEETTRDMESLSRDPLTANSVLPSRDDKQEAVVVRPYPQLQMVPHHTASPLTMTAQSTHLPAVPLSFSEGILKVCTC